VVAACYLGHLKKPTHSRHRRQREIGTGRRRTSSVPQATIGVSRVQGQRNNGAYRSSSPPDMTQATQPFDVHCCHGDTAI